MDAKRFDALSRTLSSSPSRRAALRFLAGGALSGLLARLGLEEARATHTGCRHNGATCTRLKQCCSRRCAGNGTCQPCTRASQCPSPPASEPCKKRFCTGVGECVIRDKGARAPCPDDGDPCTDDVCAAGTCTHPPKVCDGGTVCSSGACVCDISQRCGTACLCPAGANCTAQGECGCDGITCGAVCGCRNGKVCSSGGQCVCDTSQRCGADCPCPNGQDCRSNSCCALNGQSCEDVLCCSGVCDRQGEPVCVGS